MRRLIPMLALAVGCAAEQHPCPSTSAPTPAAAAATPAPSTSGTRFHDFGIVASNVAELRDFYSKLGFELAFSDGDDLVVFIVGQNELAIHTSEQRPQNAAGISFLVDDLEQMRTRLVELGVRFEGPRKMRPGLIGIAIDDPNGNHVTFLHPE